jgi:hypothetical protein
MARALAATGDGTAARGYWEQAKELTERVAEPGDRQAVLDLMHVEPAWP